MRASNSLTLKVLNLLSLVAVPAQSAALKPRPLSSRSIDMVGGRDFDPSTIRLCGLSRGLLFFEKICDIRNVESSLSEVDFIMLERNGEVLAAFVNTGLLTSIVAIGCFVTVGLLLFSWLQANAIHLVRSNSHILCLHCVLLQLFKTQV